MCATCHTFFLILSRCVVFFNDITNQTISENVEKIHSKYYHIMYPTWLSVLFIIYYFIYLLLEWANILKLLVKEKITHMWRRWGTPQSFLLALINELWKTLKIRILKKWKRLLEISSFCTYVPKTSIIWCTVPEIQSETDFFVIFGHFLPIHPPNNPKNQNFEIIKKMPGDIILFLCTTNDNHMMYCSWDIERNRHNFLSFWVIFTLLAP